MDDLEITRLCAEAMGYGYEQATNIGLIRLTDTGYYFDPLNDDAQAMALVKKFALSIQEDHPLNGDQSHNWHIGCFDPNGKRGASLKYVDSRRHSWNKNLNRALCECVAKMQKAKNE